MNDPGTADGMNELEGKIKDHERNLAAEEDEEDVTNYLDPGQVILFLWLQHRHQYALIWDDAANFANSLWWFAQTACPLIAGTFGPMANAFNICALVQPWREDIPAGGTVAHGRPLKDPSW
jgi:hypothetical protein